jgi:hypothetical protein
VATPPAPVIPLAPAPADLVPAPPVAAPVAPGPIAATAPERTEPASPAASPQRETEPAFPGEFPFLGQFPGGSGADDAAARSFTAIGLLGGLVALFLVAQGRFTRGDAKLLEAPVEREERMFR